MPLLPPGAPETPDELAIASRPLGWRLSRVAIATGVMLALLFARRALPPELLALHLPGVHERVARGLAFQAVLLAAVIALAWALAGLGNVGLRRRGAGVSIVLVLPLLLLTFAEGLPDTVPGLAGIAAVLLWATAIGLTEEIYGRGLLVTLLGGRRHAALAIVGSSVAFAYLHLPRYVELGGWRYALVRSTASAAFSITLAVVRLRSGSLAGPVAFHAVDDARYLLMSPTSPGSAAANPWAIVVGLAVSGAYALLCRRGIRGA